MLGRIQQTGGLGVRVVREKEERGTVPVVPPKVTGPNAAYVPAVEQLLGIKVKAADFRVICGAVPRDRQEIAFLTRSMLEILLDMASYIDVPPAHVSEHRAAPGFPDAGKTASRLKPLILGYSGAERPYEAFLTIRYRDQIPLASVVSAALIEFNDRFGARRAAAWGRTATIDDQSPRLQT